MNMLERAAREIAVELRGVPLIPRWVIVGAASACVVGGIVGLVVGLLAYPPTAWFAVFELGVPAGAAGGIIGLLGALILTVGRLAKRRITPHR
jgi:membrane associated rhomboid family serine protease